MNQVRRFLRYTAIVSAIVVLTSYAPGATHPGLGPAEETEFHTYLKVMTAAQARAYLAKANAAVRTAYLRTLGLVQRFEALDSQDREAILTGRQPRVGMSAEALRFLWGEPEYTTGLPAQSAHWYYRGSSFTLADRGNDSGSMLTDVYLTDGRVAGWVYVPRSTSE